MPVYLRLDELLAQSRRTAERSRELIEQSRCIQEQTRQLRLTLEDLLAEQHDNAERIRRGAAGETEES